MSSRQKKRWLVGVAWGLALTVLAVAPLVGMRAIGLSDLLGDMSENLDTEIFWRIRLPRVLLSFLAGAGLAISGMAFQAMFRNPLATPFTLGVSSGASLGATIYLRLGWVFTVGGVSGLACSAFLGAMGSILLVYGLTRRVRGFSNTTMLLAGVAVSLFFSSLILVIQYMSDFNASFKIVRWLMGGLETVGFASTLTAAPFVVSGCAIVFYLAQELDLLTLGDEIATSRGVQIERARHLLFFGTSLMVGGVVSVCGPIGFVGMIVPHICRLIIGPEHQHLAWLTLLAGGIFLTLCDTISRTLIAPAELPVGVITALLGGPFFLWMLLRGLPERRIAGP